MVCTELLLHRAGRTRVALWLVALVAAVLLLRFPPAQYGFYPRCPVHEIFGLLCPGCGGTRAVAALLHGDVHQAMHWNALVTILMPFAAILATLDLLQAMQGAPSPFVARIPDTIWASVVTAAMLFSLWRNLH